MSDDKDINGKPKKENYLYELIEKTRKARICAEKRLLDLDLFAKHVNVYYACLTTALTITTLFFEELKLLSLLSVLSAVLLTIWTMYASSQNYAVRAGEMRRCYLDLQKLLFDMDRKHDDHLWCNIDEAGERYQEILRRVENHIDEDYRPKPRARFLGYELAHPVWYYWKRILAYGVPTIIYVMVIAFSLAGNLSVG